MLGSMWVSFGLYFGFDLGSDWCFILVLFVLSLASMFGFELCFIGGSCVFYVGFYVVSVWVLCGFSLGFTWVLFGYHVWFIWVPLGYIMFVCGFFWGFIFGFI